MKIAMSELKQNVKWGCLDNLTDGVPSRDVVRQIRKTYKKADSLSTLPPPPHIFVSQLLTNQKTEVNALFNLVNSTIL